MPLPLRLMMRVSSDRDMASLQKLSKAVKRRSFTYDGTARDPPLQQLPADSPPHQ